MDKIATIAMTFSYETRLLSAPSPHCRYTQPDFLLVRSWIPAMLFSAAVTFGTFGRQLAIATGNYFDQGMRVG
jgi:hypothetical protein